MDLEKPRRLDRHKDMTKEPRNSPCPCGSWKLYKKCYAVDPFRGNTCVRFLKDHVKKNVEEIQEFFDSATNEVSNACMTLRENSYPTLRIECIVIFSYLEVLAKLRSVFVDYRIEWNKPWQKEMVVKRFDDFVAIPWNKWRLECVNAHDLTWGLLYKLRSKLVHHFAIPNVQEGNKDVFINSNSTDDRAVFLKKQWRIQKKRKLIILSSQDIYHFVVDWALIMLDKINEHNAKADDRYYLEWIQRLANELSKNGAKIITVL